LRSYTIRFSKEIIEALNFIEANILKHYGTEDVQLFYGDYRRRVELLSVILHLTPKGARVLDAGSAPGFTSLALSLLGYEVYSLDIDPEPYRTLLEKYGVKVIKTNLEDEVIPLEDEYVDHIVFTEVLEHLNPYYVKHALSEINRILRREGILILTTPNIASLFRRLKLLLGKQSTYRYHVKEYTREEVEKLLQQHGFEILISQYSEIYDKNLLKPSSENQLTKIPHIDNYLKMIKFVLRNPSRKTVAVTHTSKIVRWD